MDPSQTSFFQLLGIGTKMVGPGASEIVLDPATVALVDGASVFVFKVIFQEVGTFHLAFDTNAFTLSSTGGVALVSPAIFNIVAPDSEEPIEDFLLRSTLMKESWRLPTGARWSETRRAAWRWPFLLDKVTESTCLHRPWISQPI